ncbi:MarR family transcriptional regulator [Nocardiopsis sp. HNM0947]|uniref:MarR family transcriptional regulator n=1 Tax=Nocardiopsis coralli TaxID=2772213 RepID=A0ABR9P9Y1_9ACTN|nr:MarR family transcriptional regulator [Nocardiopsis coralli]MBE3000648.1 MarR family transcriptional regulator [Nocardiopsis coralli]
MPEKTSEQLIAEYTTERRALARMLAGQRMQPFLGLELTLHQLKIVLLVATGSATTGRELARSLQVSAPTVSASVDKLVALGYLAREESGADRRVTRLVATPMAGDIQRQFLAEPDPSTEVLTSLHPDDLDALVRGMTALRRAIEQRS